MRFRSFCAGLAVIGAALTLAGCPGGDDSAENTNRPGKPQLPAGVTSSDQSGGGTSTTPSTSGGTAAPAGGSGQ